MERPAPRFSIAVAAALLGFLAVLAARLPPQATREVRRLELVDLIEAEDARIRRLRGEVAVLQTQLTEAEAISVTGELRRLRARVETLSIQGGSAGLEGTGVVATLDDSSARRSPTGDPNDLVVHERDIQAVVNALWAGQAEAVAVNGERLTAGSAIRCAGNTLLLHGALHSPPYRIAAIGPPDTLAASLTDGPGMGRLLDAVRSFGLGFEVETTMVRIATGPVPSSLFLARPAETA